MTSWETEADKERRRPGLTTVLLDRMMMPVYDPQGNGGHSGTAFSNTGPLATQAHRTIEIWQVFLGK
jgi:hypothetical protein